MLLKIAPLVLAAAFLSPAHAQVQSVLGDLTVSVAAPEAKQGAILVALFDSAHAWGVGKPVRVATVSAAGAAPSANIAGLPPGAYAVRAFQDVNENGKLDANPFGLPVEPYGFSRDARPNMGPPAFEAAAFTVTAGANAQTIHLH